MHFCSCLSSPIFNPLCQAGPKKKGEEIGDKHDKFGEQGGLLQGLAELKRTFSLLVINDRHRRTRLGWLLHLSDEINYA